MKKLDRVSPTMNPGALNKPDHDEILADYKIAYISREASLWGRKEVLSGKAKFGIFGDGKELAQVALAKFFKKGDWRSGYYRDQTMMMALGCTSVRQFFAQLYADTNVDNEPASAGRQMNSHFASRFIDARGNWMSQLDQYNSSADASPTASQMPRLLGLGYASKLYRTGQLDTPKTKELFSCKGDEIAFGTIGNASCAEGLFWESLNAAAVLQVPVVMSIWDDGYGISVPNHYQIGKNSISELISGFQTSSESDTGIDIYKVKGWDYIELVECYRKATEKTRKTHRPCLIHVYEMTQPQGHSTSSSHERYKDAERLKWEVDFDCITKMRQWILDENVTSNDKLESLEKEWRDYVDQERRAAWDDYYKPIEADRDAFINVLESIQSQGATTQEENDLHNLMRTSTKTLKSTPSLFRRTVMAEAKALYYQSERIGSEARHSLKQYIKQKQADGQSRYNSMLMSSGSNSTLSVPAVEANYSSDPKTVPGSEIIRGFFEKAMEADARIFAIGEDVGHLGGVNQGFKDLQEKFGESRVTDTGIREATILGQGIGSALRGLRPIVDIQYLDYMLYCFQSLSDDLATLHYRTFGAQLAPVIVRTRGHRLEGIWHTGSPMGVLIHGLRGMHLCVPRNMTQAAGMYRSLLNANDPGIVIEVLNSYRLREAVPSNLGEFSVPLGMPEILSSGTDVTLVTYGACVAVAQKAVERLKQYDISVELIDVQTLLPFDRTHTIGASLEKTNAVVFLDEDVPGGASAYMMEQVLQQQNAYDCLDAKPICITAQPHRAAYASDGDYWSKPNSEDVFEAVYKTMHERYPHKFAELDC